MKILSFALILIFIVTQLPMMQSMELEELEHCKEDSVMGFDYRIIDERDQELGLDKKDLMLLPALKFQVDCEGTLLHLPEGRCAHLENLLKYLHDIKSLSDFSPEELEKMHDTAFYLSVPFDSEFVQEKMTPCEEMTYKYKRRQKQPKESYNDGLLQGYFGKNCAQTDPKLMHYGSHVNNLRVTNKELTSLYGLRKWLSPSKHYH